MPLSCTTDWAASESGRARLKWQMESYIHWQEERVEMLRCSGAPVDAEQHEQPSSSTPQPGQVREGRADAPTGVGAEGEGAGLGAPVDAEQHEQPSTRAPHARWRRPPSRAAAGRPSVTSRSTPESHPATQATRMLPIEAGQSVLHRLPWVD